MSWMRDPTAETSSVKRARRAPPASLAGLTVGLFDIGKTRSDEFFNQIEKRFTERGLKVKRFGKPTNAKVATPENVQKVVDEADVVVIGLSD
ncbi:MAG: hypothetical protein OEP48_06680 [Betaproteobacteria bacterium]|nr:hypothetical protein [Betaproteobacteria bacterium]MDH3436148.1 hypothetical protein [Betaproteobacteria bacterium]